MVHIRQFNQTNWFLFRATESGLEPAHSSQATYYFAAAGSFAFGFFVFQGIDRRHPSDKQKVHFFQTHNTERHAHVYRHVCIMNCFSRCINVHAFRTCSANKQADTGLQPPSTSSFSDHGSNADGKHTARVKADKFAN